MIWKSKLYVAGGASELSVSRSRRCVTLLMYWERHTQWRLLCCNTTKNRDEKLILDQVLKLILCNIQETGNGVQWERTQAFICGVIQSGKAYAVGRILVLIEEESQTLQPPRCCTFHLDRDHFLILLQQIINFSVASPRLSLLKIQLRLLIVSRTGQHFLPDKGFGDFILVDECRFRIKEPGWCIKTTYRLR